MVDRVSGLVERLYVDDNGCNIRLSGVDPAPVNAYFELRRTHPNYNALYSLALGAAMNRYPLDIRTVDDIAGDRHAVVQYLVVDW